MTDKIKEIGYAITKGGLGAVPLAGGVLSELFGLVFSEPSTKRKQQVISDIEDRLAELESKGFDLKELQDNEEFISIAIQAYHIALRTHQSDKRAALMNTIYNTPKLSIDENEKLMFLNYIDQFNEWHLRVLVFLNNPNKLFEDKEKPNYMMAGRSSILESAYPELRDRRVFYDQIVKDLYSRGLIAVESLHGTMSGDSLFNSSTTETGQKFINFITKD